MHDNGPTHAQMTSLLILVLLFGLAATILPALFGASDRYEYQIVSPSDVTVETEMNKLGKEGWDVVSARRATSGSGYSASYEFVLRRRIGAFAALAP